ncbi:hypothetical protein [Microcoleus sp. CAWBG27]|nr:hypothetical protein [Microcoleus sp. CAWBG27]
MESSTRGGGFGFCRRGLNRRVSLNQLDGIFNPLGMGLVFVDAV